MNLHCLGADIDKHICECVGCFSKATTTIEVKVGILGVIPLLLCHNCINKFRED